MFNNISDTRLRAILTASNSNEDDLRFALSKSAAEVEASALDETVDLTILDYRINRYNRAYDYFSAGRYDSSLICLQEMWAA